MAQNKIELAASLLSRSGAGLALRRLPAWNGVLVLCYHRVGARGSSAWERTLWDVTVDELDAQLALLRRHAAILTPDEMLALDEPPRGRHVLLTFDDGYREWATDVLPVLRSHGASAAFFLSTGFIDRPRAPWWYELPAMVRRSRRGTLPACEWLSRPLELGDARDDIAADALLDVYKSLPGDHTEPFLDWVAEATGSGRCDPAEVRDDWLTWDRVRELRDAGMEIGGHTVDHPVLSRLAPADQMLQIAGCVRRLEAEVDRPVRMFSYPVGLPDSFDRHARQALEAQGVELAFAYNGGFVRSGQAFDRLAVPRVTGGMAPEIFRGALAFPQLFARW
jgi:peptidoglycan/xylan/chitin deacetylase (PgdA/CDA1 family)